MQKILSVVVLSLVAGWFTLAAPAPAQAQAFSVNLGIGKVGPYGSGFQFGFGVNKYYPRPAYYGPPAHLHSYPKFYQAPTPVLVQPGCGPAPVLVQPGCGPVNVTPAYYVPGKVGVPYHHH